MSGLFWKEEIKPSKIKARIPDPVWLAPDYLPGLDEARKFDVLILTDDELIALKGKPLICDIELYQNYFLCAFQCPTTRKSIYFEEACPQLEWILHNFQIITFNGNHFDIPILALALAGKTTEEMKHAAKMLIEMKIKPWEVLKAFEVEQLQIDHIDLIEVAPLKGSLKIYGGRLNSPRMQDLPFPPDTILSDDQKQIIKHYCINDLITTIIIWDNLKEQLALREKMSEMYKVDLRSKSDAQIAEAVIKKELMRLNNAKVERPNIRPGTTFRYKPPSFLKFQTEAMRKFLEELQMAQFAVLESGKLATPNCLVDPACRHHSDPKKRKGIKLPIAGKLYTFGIGGMHSNEKKIAFKSDEQFKIIDRDVASYYPAIILNQGLYPGHLGQNFLRVYRSIVEQRLAAKRRGDKIEADAKKITINGGFGKFGSKWSALYSPNLLIQTTLTGQLSLLMLVESLELAGISVISANTDGVVMRFPRVMQKVLDRIVSEWEKITNFETEETEYTALYSRDVNTYVAIKPDGKAKTKGDCLLPEGIFRFHKNPTNLVCREAVVAYLTKGIPVETTIRECRDFTRFLSVRHVKGGAVKDGIYLGKAIRWYFSTGAVGNIVYATTGNKVPESDGAEPCMQMPDEFPSDVDYGRYENEAYQILKDIGAL